RAGRDEPTMPRATECTRPDRSGSSAPGSPAQGAPRLSPSVGDDESELEAAHRDDQETASAEEVHQQVAPVAWPGESELQHRICRDCETGERYLHGLVGHRQPYTRGNIRQTGTGAASRQGPGVPSSGTIWLVFGF